MAAVPASRERVTELLADHPDVVVCNHNAPEQVVVGGPGEAVAAFVRRCADEGLDARTLPVSAAFHTRYVAHAVDRFAAALASTPVAEPSAPVYPNTDGASYGADPAPNAAVLARQLLEPVEFVAAVRAAHAAGATVFVEFGPKQVLTRLVRQILPDAGVVAIATDAGPLGDSDVTLKAAAVQLAVLGVPLADINRYQAEPPAAVTTKGPTVTLSAPEYTPPTRRDAYAAALTSDYRLSVAAIPVQAPAANAAAPAVTPSTTADTAATVARAVTTPPPAATAPAVASSVAAGAADLVGASGVHTNGAHTNGVHTGGAHANGAGALGAPTNGASVTGQTVTSAEVNGATTIGALAHGGVDDAHPYGAPVGVGGAIPAVSPDDVLAQQVNLHAVYLTGQLDVASRLVDALHEYQRGGREDPRFADAIATVANQSVVIGQTHAQANDVLAQLAELELATLDPTAPGAVGRRVLRPPARRGAGSPRPGAPRPAHRAAAERPCPSPLRTRRAERALRAVRAVRSRRADRPCAGPHSSSARAGPRACRARPGRGALDADRCRRGEDGLCPGHDRHRDGSGGGSRG
ncbi:Putative multi-domain beta-ketoacyl synthase (fragment) [Frankia canadensis]|uniref:Multi-domain beta-ketoacyl synthase n=2 Tax=Frankia canadensis TaxID=1836972 RepID=A0A2I2KJ34_9ACTN